MPHHYLHDFLSVVIFEQACRVLIQGVSILFGTMVAHLIGSTLPYPNNGIMNRLSLHEVHFRSNCKIGYPSVIWSNSTEKFLLCETIHLIHY